MLSEYKQVVEGKGGIVARIVADSVSPSGVRITTFELEYHRFIHSELMTHRLFSRNAMSSRAVPIKKMIEQVRSNPATPVHWGANQSGMQAEKECNNLIGDGECSIEEAWHLTALTAASYAEDMAEAGYHKQVVNRILEPYQMMKTVLTATEFDNFFWLRCHSDAQPEIKELADCMYKATKKSKPEVLFHGDWHTPYVNHKCGGKNRITYCVGGLEVSLEDALKVSSSCCAQVSYRVLDDSLDKALYVYDRLVESKPVHASPFEHQATPCEFKDELSLKMYWLGEEIDQDTYLWEPGTTHIDSNGEFWSGNFKGWTQHRQLIDNHTCWGYEDDTN